MTPLTPAELIKDLKALDRIEHDFLHGPYGLDSLAEEDIAYKRAVLMDELRSHFTTGQTKAFDDWFAYEGIDAGRVMPIGYGPTELEAIECLLELIGEDA